MKHRKIIVFGEAFPGEVMKGLGRDYVNMVCDEVRNCVLIALSSQPGVKSGDRLMFNRNHSRTDISANGDLSIYAFDNIDGEDETTPVYFSSTGPLSFGIDTVTKQMLSLMQRAYDWRAKHIMQELEFCNFLIQETERKEVNSISLMDMLLEQIIKKLDKKQGMTVSDKVSLLREGLNAGLPTSKMRTTDDVPREDFAMPQPRFKRAFSGGKTIKNPSGAGLKEILEKMSEPQPTYTDYATDVPDQIYTGYAQRVTPIDLSNATITVGTAGGANTVIEDKITRGDTEIDNKI